MPLGNDIPYLPTPDQEALLDLVINPEKSSHDVAASLDGFDVDSAGREIAALLPLLLRRWGEALPPSVRTQAGEIHRYFEFRNRLTVARLASVLQLLEAEGIQTVVLKGAALVSHYYDDIGLRFMQDADILIHRENVSRALDLLRTDGWKWKWPRKVSSLVLDTQHSIDMTHPNESQLDLHWAPLNLPWHPGNATDFWEKSEKCVIHGVSTRIFCPADQLFHVCVHAAHFTEPRGLRWIADAATILERSPDFDWDRFIDLSERREFTLWTSHALHYLHRRFNLSIPATVLSRLSDRTLNEFWQADYDGLTRPRSATSGINRGRLIWRRFRAIPPRRSFIRSAAVFPFYLRHDMHAPRFSDMITQLIKGRFR